jgi:hypothetical protein
VGREETKYPPIFGVGFGFGFGRKHGLSQELLLCVMAWEALVLYQIGHGEYPTQYKPDQRLTLK